MTNPAFADSAEAMLASQERFEALREAWFLRAGANACDLAYANAADGIDPLLIDELAAGRPAELQYSPHGFSWKDVVLTLRAMAALNIALSTVRTNERLGEQLTAYGYDVIEPGTFFLYVRPPSWSTSDEAIVEHLAQQGLFVLPAPVFHDSAALRISLAATDATTERRLPIFAASVEARA